MDTKLRNRLGKNKPKGKISTTTNQDAKSAKRKNPDLVHGMNKSEKQIPGSSDPKIVLKSLNVALNSDKRKDTLTFISDIKKNPSAVCKHSLSKALLLACNKGNKFLVQSLLVNNAEVNCRDEKQNTPLMLCALNGFCDIARLLIERGADVNCINSHGDSALILSVTNSGSTDMVQLLLDQKDIDISHKNNKSQTCLSRAVEMLDFNIIEMILQKAEPNDSEEEWRKKYVQQMISHAQNVAKSLGILKIFEYVNKEIKEKKPALLIAVSQGDLESVDFLLKFVFLRKFKEEYLHEGFIMQVLQFYEERNTDLSENDFEIVRKLVENDKLVSSYMLSMRDEEILSKAINVGNYKLLDILCQYIVNSNQVCTNLMEVNFFKGLVKTCAKCSCECLNVLLKYKPEFSFPYINPTNLIKKPLEMGAVEFVELFLSHFSSFDVAETLNTIIENGQTKCFNLILNKFPLEVASVICNSQSDMFHTAAKVGNKDIINKLLELGADVNRIYQDKTPLLYCRKPETANILFEHGADVNFKVKSSEINVILNLFSMDYFYNVDKITPSYYFKEDISSIGKLSETVIQLKKDLIHFYLEHGVDIQAKDSKGESALMLVSKLEGCETILEILLQSGADPNMSNEGGKTALHFAVSENHLKNVETLLNYSADVNKRCHLGLTCLHLCANKQDIEMVRLLFKHGADVNLDGYLGNTPLLLAANIADVNSDFLNYLIDIGSNVNHINKEGFSALMFASDKGSLESIKILCEKGADINARNSRDLKNVVDILLENYLSCSHFSDKDYLNCTKYVLDNGGSAAHIKIEVVFELITRGQLNLVQKLIFAGLSPSDCPIDQCGLNTKDLSMLPSMSPFCYALWSNKVELAQYFNDISFLTALDISGKERVEILRLLIFRKEYLKSLKYIDDFYSRPMSLEKLCLVSVSSTLGSGIERENKVKKLPLPTWFKEKLLYKTENVLHTAHFDDIEENVDSLDMDETIFTDNDSYDDDEDDYGSIYYGNGDDTFFYEDEDEDFSYHESDFFGNDF
ncbi:hypothetical protein Btru_019695 [Bulinus truncatus]|nr:hypothetical protein Btru_019695 [Bulinus truncatus]